MKKENKIKCYEIAHQGLPTEYYFPQYKCTTSPQIILGLLQKQWPDLLFTLDIIKYKVINTHTLDV